MEVFIFSSESPEAVLPGLFLRCRAPDIAERASSIAHCTGPSLRSLLQLLSSRAGHHISEAMMRERTSSITRFICSLSSRLPYVLRETAIPPSFPVISSLISFGVRNTRFQFGVTATLCIKTESISPDEDLIK